MEGVAGASARAGGTVEAGHLKFDREVGAGTGSPEGLGGGDLVVVGEIVAV